MHIAVIGAGVFGVWTAHHLLAAGAQVTLIDAYGPGNARASSGDDTRILRCGYGPDRLYSELALRSLGQWRDLDSRLRSRDAAIWHGCGVLWMASEEDPYFAASVDALSRGPYRVEILAPAALRARFPAFVPPPGASGLFEPDAGVLMARRAVQALAAELEQRGVRILRERVAPNREPLTSDLRPLTSDLRPLTADAYVYACGAWLGQIFPDLLGDRIRPTRQVVVYFRAPQWGDRFSSARMPAWIMGTSFYGTPEADGHGLKVGNHDIGPPMDPDGDDRVADAASIDRARAWLVRHIPALANAVVTDARVCQYENTDTGDFLIDRHPDRDNVWLVGGGSGHGFKHGPAVGEHVASLVMGTAEPEPRFALNTKGLEPARRVY